MASKKQQHASTVAPDEDTAREQRVRPRQAKRGVGGSRSRGQLVGRPRSAFTLIELLIVIAIVSLLTAILIPNLLGARTRAFDVIARTCARSIAVAQEVSNVDEGGYASSFAVLDTGIVRDCEGGVSPIVVDDSTDFSTDGWSVTHTSGSGTTMVVGPGGLR